MASNEEKRVDKSEGTEAKSEGRGWHYLAVKRNISIIKGNSIEK